MSIVCLVRQNAILLSFDILKLQYLGFEILCFFFPFEENPAYKANWKNFDQFFIAPLMR